MEARGVCVSYHQMASTAEHNHYLCQAKYEATLQAQPVLCCRAGRNLELVRRRTSMGEGNGATAGEPHISHPRDEAAELDANLS